MAREWYSRPINSGYTVVDGTTTGNYNNGVPNTYVKTWMEYKVLQDSTDIANNRSRIDVKLYSQVIDGGSSTGMSSATTANNYGYVGFDNANQSYLSTTYNFNNYALNKFADATLTIPHNTDGTKSITLQGSFQTLSGTWAITGGSASASVTLPTIPKGTEITSVNFLYYGMPTQFYMSRKSSNFREQVTMTNGSTTLTIKTTSTADVNFEYNLARSYTPNTAYPSPSTWTVSVKTYNGSTLVETKNYSYTWNISDYDKSAYMPYASYSVQAYNDVVSQLGTDTAVAGYSKINVIASSANATARNNATITSRVVRFQDGRTVSGANDTNHISNLINTAGSYSFTYTITDSRGLSVTYNGSYNVISSSAPTIDVKECYRGDSSGNASDTGTYIWAKITTSYDSLNGHNAITVRQGQVSGMSAVNMSENTRVALASNTALVTNAYTVTFTATDRLRTTTVTRSIASEDIPLNIREGGKGVGIGAYCEGEGLISVGYQFSGAIKSKGDRIFGTCNLIDQASLEQGSLNGSGIQEASTTRLITGFSSALSGNTKYTWQRVVSGGNLRAYLFEYNASKGFITYSSLGTATFTFTTNANTKYIRFLMEYTNSATILPSAISNLQLEEGSSASPYVPYAMDNVELTERSKGKKHYFTPTNCTANSGYDGCYYYKEGDIVHLHMGCQSPTSKNATYEMSGLPVGYRPKDYVASCGWASDTGAVIVPVWVWVRSNGVISFNTQGNYFIVDLSFLAEG